MKFATTISIWLSITSAIIVFAVLAYLLVAGQGLGLKVSSLDGSGPTWPFTVVWCAGVAALFFAAAAIVLGVVRWAAKVVQR
jgi:Na+-driven multidrug efflux pump